MVKSIKYIILPIGMIILLMYGCSHPSLTVYDYGTKQIVVVFLDQEESYNYIQNSDFTKGMNRLNISLRLDEDIPENDEDNGLTEYNNFISEKLQDWYGYERNVVWGAAEDAIDELSVFAPSVLPDTLYFIITSPSMEFNAFLTINKAIVVPSNVVWPIFFKGMIKNYIAHELFHIYSRYHELQRDSLYALFNFHQADTVEIGKYLEPKMIRNPDVHDNNYFLRLRDSTGVANNYVLLVQLDEKEYNNNRGITSFLNGANIFGFFDTYLYKLDEYNDNCYEVHNKENPTKIDMSQFKNGFDLICGSLTNDRSFAEEIAAETFVSCLEADKDSTVLRNYNVNERELIRKFIKILRED